MNIGTDFKVNSMSGDRIAVHWWSHELQVGIVDCNYFRRIEFLGAVVIQKAITFVLHIGSLRVD